MQDSSIIDLHCHSTASDGTYAPKEVAALAQKIGLSAIALTDHDTIDGLAEFQAAGNALGIEAIAGIEFAALWEHFHRPEIHIVGLGFDPAHPVLKGRMETIRSSRDIRNRRMCERLSSIGLHLTLDEVAANAGGEIITRAHFANILLEKGYIKKKADAFTRYISPGLPGYFYLAEYLNLFIVASVAATIFLGGWMPLHIVGLDGFNTVMDYIPGFIWFFAKAFFVVFLLMWIKWTFPRLRIDQILNLEWKYLVPISMVNLLLMACCVAFGFHF